MHLIFLLLLLHTHFHLLLLKIEKIPIGGEHMALDNALRGADEQARRQQTSEMATPAGTRGGVDEQCRWKTINITLVSLNPP